VRGDGELLPITWRSWRSWPRQFAALFRRSLQFRTVLITITLSGLAILVIGLYISFSIASNLFQTRLDQVLDASTNAESAAQAVLDSSDATDRAALQSVLRSAIERASVTASSPLVAVYRAPGQEPSAVAPQDQGTNQLTNAITDQLRATVQENPGSQFWQSVEFVELDGAGVPGVVVGSDVELPTAGRYELYIGYNLADADATLAFMQFTGVVGAIALLVLLAVITLLVVRWVIEPIQAVSATSRRFAGGDLGVRMEAKGEDELATLAESFNGMADSLQQRIHELAELSVMQQRFVSDVSHELRTPLTTIRLAGDVLYQQREDFRQSTSRTVELLHTQTERFETLLADLLEISRYDAGSVELQTEPTNLVHLATDAVEGMRSLAEERGSDVRVVAPGGHLDAEVDPRRIRRVVRNLLGNAIEHGEGRPIVVSVDSDEHAVALAVRDYGLGMTAEDADRVFDRFWRADPSRKRSIGGTGLGLAISLEDAHVHGGWLEVWSEPGGGSCFRLTLPRRAGGVIESSPLHLPPDDAAGADPEVARLVESVGSTGPVPTAQDADLERSEADRA